jgi:hypothetical protein
MCSDLVFQGMALYLTNDDLVLTFPTIVYESGFSSLPPMWDHDPPKEEEIEDEDERDKLLSQSPTVVVTRPAPRPKKERATLLSGGLQSPQRKNENSRSTRS